MNQRTAMWILAVVVWLVIVKVSQRAKEPPVSLFLFPYALIIAFFLSWWLETRGIVSPNPPRAEPRRSSPSACQLAGDCEFIEPDSYQFEENVWGE